MINSKGFQTAMLCCIILGLLMVAVGAAMPILQHSVAGNTFRYIFAVGAGLQLIGRLFTPYDGDNLQLKRLHRIEGWSAIVFCVAAFLMFYNEESSRDWIAFTLAGAAILIYTSVRIPMVERKQAAGGKK